jgi:hypothetical protein
MAAVPFRPPAEAVIVTDPSSTAVTNPDDDTVALVSLSLTQDTAADTTSLRPFRTVACSCCVAPMSTVADVGETVTLAIASSGSGSVPPSPPHAARVSRAKDTPMVGMKERDRCRAERECISGSGGGIVDCRAGPTSVALLVR